MVRRDEQTNVNILQVYHERTSMGDSISAIHGIIIRDLTVPARRQNTSVCRATHSTVGFVFSLLLITVPFSFLFCVRACTAVDPLPSHLRLHTSCTISEQHHFHCDSFSFAFPHFVGTVHFSSTFGNFLYSFHIHVFICDSSMISISVAALHFYLYLSFMHLFCRAIDFHRHIFDSAWYIPHKHSTISFHFTRRALVRTAISRVPGTRKSF